MSLFFGFLCCTSLTESFLQIKTQTRCQPKPFFCTQDTEPSVLISVYDEVIDAAICQAMDVELKAGCLSHTVFFRDSSPRTIVESVIHSLLTSINDVAPIVEYWWRDEWINLELHRDLDEKLALENGPHRCPNHAHVLYLDVGELAQGPTIVLTDSAEKNSQSFEKISVIPAVAGRLLRFEGHMMHAVPRPSLAYLDPDQGGSNLELWSRQRSDENSDLALRRSVLLFNTWTDSPPVDISLVPPKKSSEAKLLLALEKTVSHTCARENWKCVSPISSTDNISEHLVRLKMGLLGNIRRRERSDRYLNLYGPVSMKESLVSSGGQPMSFPLSQKH